MSRPERPELAANTGQLVGLVLDRRYQLVAVIAAGGMATVYRGFDHRLQRTIAVKVMSSHLTSDAGLVARFAREAQSMAQMSHPGIVAVHDHGVDAGHLYLVMEMIDGGNLRDVLQARGHLTVPEAVTVLTAVVEALDHAHAAGLIHRDIKPENILVASTGAIKLTDFGLVRPALTQTMATGDAILGTVAYMAPEQITTGFTDTRTDVYSLGIVTFEMLTGSRPFTGDNPLTIAYQHVHQDVPPPSSRQPGTPRQIDYLVHSATHRDSSSRLHDAGAFRAAASAVVQALQIPTAAVYPPPRSQPTRAAADTLTWNNPGAASGNFQPPTAAEPPWAATRLLPTTHLDNRPPTSSGRRRRTRRLLAALSICAVLVAVTSLVVLTIARDSNPGNSSPSNPVPLVSSNTAAGTPLTSAETTSQQGAPPAAVPAPTPTQAPAPPTVTTTATVTPTSSPPTAAPTSAAPKPDQVAAHWTEGPTRVGGGTAPPFPAALQGWRLNEQWDLTDRVFDGTWTEVSGPNYSEFPSTMNGCDDQRFLVRWRAINDNATVRAAWADAIDNVHEEVTDTAGWFDLDGCAHPVLTFASSSDDSTLTDVAVSVQQYWPAA